MRTEQFVTPDAVSVVVDAIRAFPAEREVTHCGVPFTASPLAVYGVCPACGAKVKLRSFAAVPELEDVFDAVLEWMNQPAASAHAEARRRELTTDND